MKKERKSSGKINSSVNNSIFKIAAYSAIALVIFSFLGVIISKLFASSLMFVSYWSIIQNIVVTLLTVIFTYGFYVLGKKYDQTSLKVISIILIVFTVISALVSLFILSPISVNLQNSVLEKVVALNLDPTNVTEEQSALLLQSLFSDQQFLGSLAIVLGLFLSYVIVFAILSIIFGISLIKLKEKVKYAKVAGILEIIGGATLIIIVGVLPLIVSFVYQIIILFKENKN